MTLDPDPDPPDCEHDWEFVEVTSSSEYGHTRHETCTKCPVRRWRWVDDQDGEQDTFASFSE